MIQEKLTTKIQNSVGDVSQHHVLFSTAQDQQAWASVSESGKVNAVLSVKADMSAVNVPVGSGWEEKQPCNYRDQWNIVWSNHSYFGVFILQYDIP